MGAGNGVGGIGGQLEQLDHPRQARTEGQRSGGRRQPALYLGSTQRFGRQPLTGISCITQRQVHQDGIGVGQGHVTVLDHRHLAECIHCQKFWLLVLVRFQINLDQLKRQTEQRQKQLDPVGMTRHQGAVKLDRTGGHVDSLKNGLEGG